MMHGGLQAVEVAGDLAAFALIMVAGMGAEFIVVGRHFLGFAFGVDQGDIHGNARAVAGPVGGGVHEEFGVRGFADEGNLSLWWAPGIPQAQTIALLIEQALSLSELVRGADAQQAGHVRWVNRLAGDVVFAFVTEVDTQIGDDLTHIDELIAAGALKNRLLGGGW